MNDEDLLRKDIHQALDAIRGSTPDLLPGIVPRLRATPRGPMPAMAQAAAVLAIGLLVGAIVLSTHRPRVASNTITTAPAVPIAAGPGASIAWVDSQLQGGGGDVLTGIDAAGHVIGRINAPVELRSPDGSHLYAVQNNEVDTYSAVDGHREQVIPLRSVRDAWAPMLSPDGRYLVVAGGSGAVELVDLVAARSVATLSVGLPQFGTPVVIGPQARHLYVVGETIVKLAFDGASLRVEQQTSVPTVTCPGLVVGGPNASGGLPFRVLADGHTLVAFCPGDGVVTWFDLDQMRVMHQERVPIANPFWISPVFSPDGTVLYLHEGGTGKLTVMDLTRETIIKSTKVAVNEFNLLPWLGSLLVTPAEAGGIPRTAAVSPDGTWLYTVGIFGAPGGVSLVHLPDLSIRGRWLPDVTFDTVWVSADGQRIYTLNQNSGELRVLGTDGSTIATLTLPADVSGFVVPSIA